MVWESLIGLIELLIFPGVFFIFWLALTYEWIDRKFYAKLQNRYGPLHVGAKGFWQPLADFIKLMVKEDIIPAASDRLLFTLTPIFLLTLSLTAFFFVPIVPLLRDVALASFEGDLILVIFLLTMIAVVKFLGAWGSTNIFGAVGGVRLAFQLLGYEIPLAICLVSPAIVAGSLSISIIAQYVGSNIIVAIALLPALAVSIVCFQAELERIPFDIPEAEQEIVAGWLTEFSGRRLALIRLSIDVELALASALLAALFLGGPYGPIIPFLPVQVSYFIWFIIKATIILLIFSNIRTLFARLRIDQMVHFSWKNLTIISLLEIVLIQALLAGGVI
ncbi:NADH-quinone oxidoreductase subunit H [Candidatus Bathyarchaeota archaeon]|nr:MAG: NADH-quinone oxidoreductase subunit H [Candidatus Bathyarchaeota archaeon]